jgi:uncharacterized protein YmfQ (DUF2313 family)
MCALELFNTATGNNRRVHKNVRTAALRLASPEYLWVWHIISSEFQIEGSKICHDQAESDHPISPRQISKPVLHMMWNVWKERN